MKLISKNYKKKIKHEDEIHFCLASQLYNRPRVTLLNALLQ